MVAHAPAQDLCDHCHKVTAKGKSPFKPGPGNRSEFAVKSGRRRRRRDASMARLDLNFRLRFEADIHDHCGDGARRQDPHGSHDARIKFRWLTAPTLEQIWFGRNGAMVARCCFPKEPVRSFDMTTGSVYCSRNARRMLSRSGSNRYWKAVRLPVTIMTSAGMPGDSSTSSIRSSCSLEISTRAEK